LENKKIGEVVKYEMYRKEHCRKWEENLWNTERWEYHGKERYYVCPLTFRERIRCNDRPV
jgi:hypothetical protein